MATSVSGKARNEMRRWLRCGMRLALTVVVYPFEYAKVLIQLGYEPLSPRRYISIDGETILLLPNIFEYAYYISRADGLRGCYRGLSAKIAGSLMSAAFSHQLADSFVPELYKFKPNAYLNDEQMYLQFQQNFKRDILTCISGVLITHPFYVIQIRMMAQFVGRETIYESILGSIKDIYRCEGISGFFVGIVPKLIFDVGCVALTSSCAYILHKHVIKHRLARVYSAIIMQFFCSTLLYPLQIAASCTIVNGTMLSAGNPPYMPIYRNWTHCLTELDNENQLGRSRSFFWRTFNNFVATATLPIHKLTKRN